MRAVDSLRQACTGCGGSCHGVRVRVLADEVARIEAIAATLGVERPVEDGRLRMVDGHCVLQANDGGCRVHATAGSAAKPVICRQYPVVVVDTGSERRVGLDPGCYTAWATRDAEPLLPEGIANSVRLDPAVERHEAGLAALLGSPGITIEGALSALVGDVPAFAERWRAHLAKAPLASLLARPDTGAYARQALMPVLTTVGSLSAAPSLALSPESDAWAVDVTRRLIVLRLVSTFPFLPGLAVLGLGGALACAWTDPEPVVFARRLAAWTRVLRAPPWWGALAPGPEEMLRLLGRS